MKFTLSIESDNAAMVDNPRYRVADILTNLAERLVKPNCISCGIVRDENGNKVGSFDLECDDDT